MTRAFDESDYLPIAALQHHAYCPRQCALIHIDGLWAENRFTVEGHQLHEAVDSGKSEFRREVRVARGLWIRSTVLGLYGRADVVQFEPGVPPLPVEYKRGRPKRNDADRVQLCAQAMCLEEMLDLEIDDGALFYGKTRRRTEVRFDARLRARVASCLDDVRTLIESGRTLRASYEPRKCDKCSLKHLCLPKGTGPNRSPSRYFARSLGASLARGAVEE